MKKALRKIAAVAMAFTLIGTGTAVTNTIAPKFDNSIVASAASCNKCHGGSYHIHGNILSEKWVNLTYNCDGKGWYWIGTLIQEIDYYCNCCGSYCGHETHKESHKEYWKK